MCLYQLVTTQKEKEKKFRLVQIKGMYSQQNECDSKIERLKSFFGKGENAGYEHFLLFSSLEHKVLRVSFCDHSPSVVHPSIVHSHFLVYTLASTNINQSVPNLVKMYMTIRSQLSSLWV